MVEHIDEGYLVESIKPLVWRKDSQESTRDWMIGEFANHIQDVSHEDGNMSQTQVVAALFAAMDPGNQPVGGGLIGPIYLHPWILAD